ncbi:MAG: DNA primase [Paracoccaceae bacterium]|nr:DNA primase [Paracoccaceae bacterium]
MSLPPGFLDELRTRTSLTQVVGRKVTWDQRKSNQAKGDMWSPCPFHEEKTASFHVDDRKGFYYCFGCHAKGDALGFIRETENVSFMEAVEILARETGMPMPARDPQAQKKADRNAQLAEVMEMAVQFYRLQLQTGAAGNARDYLLRRGLDEAAQARFDIGFAPEQRQILFSHLTGKNVAPDLIIEAGLAAKPDDGGAPYDRFRGRILFPIRDARGRAIGLGGRAMDPNARAKYLNSPETPLFDKGRSLYNHGPAREAAGKGAPLIVAEGYMDVIALAEAGFSAAVAPLGTAVTENQLALMWRISPEPIIALDGDKAGIRAAMRLIDIAFPLIEAGKSLRFCIMPEGQDPDDVIKAQGAGAMQALLDQAEPMVNLLWRRETDGKNFDSPERRAALDKSLRDALMLIKDPSIRRHYGEAVKNLRWELFDPRQGKTPQKREWTPGGKGKWNKAPAKPLASTKTSLLASAGAGVEDQLREAVILAALICHPSIIPEFEADMDTLHMSPEHAGIRDALLRLPTDTDTESAKEIIAQEHRSALDKLFALNHVQIAPPVRNTENHSQAAKCVAEELAKLTSLRGAELEISEAAEDLQGIADEGLTWRLGQAAEARNAASRSQDDDSGVMNEDQAALSSKLQDFLDSEIWVKKKR